MSQDRNALNIDVVLLKIDFGHIHGMSGAWNTSLALAATFARTLVEL